MKPSGERNDERAEARRRLRDLASFVKDSRSDLESVVYINAGVVLLIDEMLTELEMKEGRKPDGCTDEGPRATR